MSNNRNLAVGIFVLTAIVIGITLTVWFTGQRGSEAADRYLVYIDSDVSGLMLGGPVFFMGVQVGSVTRLDIVPGNPASVRVELQVDEITPVDSGTWATLAAQGITGVSVINLSAEPGVHEQIRIRSGEDLPVIPYQDSGFSALLSSAPAVMDQLGLLLTNANELLKPENQVAVATTLANARSLSESLLAHSDAIGALPGALDQTLLDIRTATAEIQGLLEEGGPNARQTLANLEGATQDLQTITSRLDSWLIRHDSDIDAFGNDGLAQVPNLIRDSRKALEELEDLLSELRREPSRVIYKPQRDEVPVKE